MNCPNCDKEFVYNWSHNFYKCFKCDSIIYDNYYILFYNDYELASFVYPNFKTLLFKGDKNISKIKQFLEIDLNVNLKEWLIKTINQLEKLKDFT